MITNQDEYFNSISVAEMLLLTASNSMYSTKKLFAIRYYVIWT